MHLDPGHMDYDTRQRVNRWMEANGCRDHIAIAPIIIKGKTAHYYSLGRKKAPNGRWWQMKYMSHDCCYVIPQPRRLRIRIPYWKVA